MTRPLALAVALACCAADVGAQTTLTFTTPAVHVTGTPITDGYRRVELAYSTQSHRWRDSSAVMLASPDSWARNWPQVALEADRRIVLTYWQRPGVLDTLTPPPVVSLDWPFAWWTRYWTDVPGAWSNPQSRADNQ